MSFSDSARYSLSGVYAIAQNTFREIYRDRVLLVLFLISFVIVLMSPILGVLSFEEQHRIYFDVIVTSSHLFSIFLTILFGSFLVHREIERQTYSTLLVRPINRNQFLIGKIIGFSFLLLITQFVWLGLCLIVFNEYRFDIFFLIFLHQFLESFILLCLATVTGLLFRPSLAFLVSLFVFIMGNSLSDLSFFAEKSELAAYQAFAALAQVIFPHFEHFNFRRFEFLTGLVDFQFFPWSYLHSLLYALLLLGIGNYVFRTRDLT